MKIVILDGYSANPGDMSWKELETLGEITMYDLTRPEETVARAADANIVLTNKVIVGRQEMEELLHLKYTGVLATGYNVVDIEAARERSITVTNVPAYSTESVAQIALAFGMKVKALTRKTGDQLPDGIHRSTSASTQGGYRQRPFVHRR